MSVLPPQWVDTMEDIDEDMNRLQQSIKRLDELHQKQLLPGLDEGLRFERDIERLQAEITSQFRQCQHKIKQIGSKGGVSNTTNEEDRLGKNVQVALATRLQELSSMFRRKQSSFLQKLKQREARTKGLLFESSFSPSSFDDDDDSMTNNRGAFTKDQLALVEDTEALVTQRDREIQEITRSISELADIFQELQTMVIDQGTLLDRIDYNIEQVNASTRSAVEELTKAENYQKRTGKIKLILLLLLIIFGLILVLIFKPDLVQLQRLHHPHLNQHLHIPLFHPI
ncbi:t-SNARE [Syncephalis plumigaleata]|nr:t-SNARE [Syncephalis plumigaleata]